MQIFLNLNGKQEGPYTLEQLQAWLQSGQLAPETPAWYDGQPNWTPVNELVAPFAPAPAVEMAEDANVAGEVFLHIEHQPEYSRGQLLLRMFFGWLTSAFRMEFAWFFCVLLVAFVF